MSAQRVAQAFREFAARHERTMCRARSSPPSPARPSKKGSPVARAPNLRRWQSFDLCLRRSK